MFNTRNSQQKLGLNAERIQRIGIVGVLSFALSSVLHLHGQNTEQAQLALEAADPVISEGYEKLQSGDSESALSLFKSALEDNAENLSALLGTAMIYSEREEHGKAFDFYDSIVQQYPRHAFAWNGRGLAAYNMEDFETALSSFKNAVADRPVNGFFYESIAWTHLCRGEYNEAANSAKIATLMYTRNGETSIYPLLIAYFSYIESGNQKDAKLALEYIRKNNKAGNIWPAPVVDYLNDSITASELIAYVSNTAEETEAHVYIGLKLEQSEQIPEAKVHFDWVSQHGDKRVFEYTLARTISMRDSIAALMQ